MLDDDERARAARFRFDRDRDAFVFRRAALKVLLGRYLDADASELRIRAVAGGKPVLAPPFDSSDIRFSLARSGATTLFAIALGRDVGIDLECIRTDLDVEAMARQVFSHRDMAGLTGLPACHRIEAFFAGWARREALVKADGSGLSRALTRVDVPGPADPGAPASGPWDVHTDTGLWSLLDLDVGPKYRAAIAVRGHAWQIQCWNLPGLGDVR